MFDAGVCTVSAVDSVAAAAAASIHRCWKCCPCDWLSPLLYVRPLLPWCRQFRPWLEWLLFPWLLLPWLERPLLFR